LNVNARRSKETEVIMAEAKNDFDIAKNLFEQLEGLQEDRQRRILRWVAETLGIKTRSPEPQHGPLPTQDPSVRPITPASSDTGGKDIKSFVGSKNPKSDIQFAAVVAYYYRFEAPPEGRKDTISSEILQNSTRLVGRDRLAKPHLTLNNAKNLGYLDSAGRGSFRINTVGENLVAMTLPGQQNEGAPASPRPRRQARGRKRVRGGAKS
jgi:hypothetical protein